MVSNSKSMRALFLFLALLATDAHALVDGTIPREVSWQKWIRRILEGRDRSERILLAQYAPGLFGFHFACQFTSAAPGAAPSAVLPGDRISAPEGGKLHCPDSYDFTLAKATTLWLGQAHGVPAVSLDDGSVTLTMRADPIILETPSAGYGLAGRGKAIGLSLAISKEQETLICGYGVAAGTFEVTNPAMKQLLIMGHCGFALTGPDGALVRYLGEKDKVSLANIFLSRGFWPTDTSFFYHDHGLGLSLDEIEASLVPTAAPNEPIQLAWKANTILPTPASPPLKLDCVVYGQKTEAESATEITRFSTQATEGKVPIDPSFHAGNAWIICESADVSESSKIIRLDGTPAVPAGTGPLLTPPAEPQPAPAKTPALPPTAPAAAPTPPAAPK
jgi:hypothetical protein